jgi:uncharacterized membrane protein (UPF0127 family)
MKIAITMIIIAALAIPIAFFTALLAYTPVWGTENATVCFPGACIDVEVADTPTSRAQGLMYREQLPEDRGMIFVFATEDFHSFWMMNTYIPLDIIWINSNFSIVHTEHAIPCIAEDRETCVLYTPDQKALYVVEVNSGFVEEHGIGVGDTITIN